MKELHILQQQCVHRISAMSQAICGVPRCNTTEKLDWIFFLIVILKLPGVASHWMSNSRTSKGPCLQLFCCSQWRILAYNLCMNRFSAQVVCFSNSFLQKPLAPFISPRPPYAKYLLRDSAYTSCMAFWDFSSRIDIHLKYFKFEKI